MNSEITTIHGSIVLDLEVELYLPLIEHLQVELEREYQKGVVNKGRRLLETGLSRAVVEADEVRAEICEANIGHKVIMTLPIYDMGGGYSYIQCSCQRERLHLDENRCEHMWLTQEKVLQKLKSLLQKEDEKEGWQLLFNRFDSFFTQAAPNTLTETVAPLAAKERIIWRLDAKLELTVYLQTCSASGNFSPGKRLGWREFLDRPGAWNKTDQLLAARVKPKRQSLLDDFEIDIFGMLKDLAEHDLLFWADEPSRHVSIIEGKISLAVDQQENGIRVQANINGKVAASHMVFPGQGYVTLDQEEKKFYFAALDRPTTDLLDSVINNTKTIPLDETPRLLDYIIRLERHLPISVSESIVSNSDKAPDERNYLRLTPMDPRGLKVEILRKPSPTGAYFPPGEGAERLLDLTEKKAPQNILRDLREERLSASRMALLLGLDRHPCYHEHIWYLRQDEHALDLVDALNRINHKEAVVVEWPEKTRKRYELAAPSEQEPIKLNIGQGESDWFDLQGRLPVGDESVDLHELLAALRNKLRYIQLASGSWVKITQTFTERLERLQHVIEENEGRLAIGIGALPIIEELETVCQEILIETASAVFERLRQGYQQSKTADATLPAGFKGLLRSYQQIGYEWLCRMATWGVGCCLADDMGLGKTVQTLALLLKRSHLGPSLIITPTSVSHNWLIEARKFTPELRPILWRESSRGELVGKLKSGDLVLISYGLVHRDIEDLIRLKWNVVVFDEAQAVKNAHTRTAQAVNRLQQHWRLALTGTPIENNLSEIWSLFKVLAPEVLGSWDRFKSQFVIPIERYHNRAALSRLTTTIKPFILRRLKKDCLKELPAKTEINLAVELDEEESQLYAAFRLEALENLQAKLADGACSQGPEKMRFDILAALTRMRQLSCHPRLVDSQWQHSSSKVELFKSICTTLKQGAHRALIFSQFTSFLDILGDALDDLEFTYLRIDGSTVPKRRAELVEIFQRGQFDFFLISLKAGGTGLNLTGADYVLHMDPWWNPAVEDQATDRVHRMGQKKPVTVYRFVAQGTVEEKILLLHGAKRNLTGDLLTGTDKSYQLSPAALMALLE